MSLSGTTRDFPLDVLLRLLSDTKKTGELALRGSEAEGALGIAEGRVVAAVFGEEPPIPALGAIFDLGEANFEFTPWDEAPPSNLEGDLDTLLRQADEHKKWLASVREVIPNDRYRFRLSERAADQGTVSFTADRWRVVLAVNGQRNVNDVASHLSVDRNAALDLLAGLVRDGVIETVEPPTGPEPAPPPPAPVPAAETAAAWEATPAPPPEPAPLPAPPPAPETWGAAAPSAPAGPEPSPAPEESAPAPEAWSAPAPAADAWSAPPAEAPAPEAPAPEATPSWGAPPAADSWAPAQPVEPEAPQAAPPMDDRLAALFGNAPATPAEPAPAADQWTTPATDQWAPAAPEATLEPAVDPRLAAMSAPPVAEPPVEQPEAPAAPPNEWAPPPAAEAPQKKGLFGRFRRDEASPEPATRTTLVDRSASSRAGLLAAFSNALLTEYNSGHYGKNRVDDRIPSLLMRVDEQADPIDRPLPVVDDRLDVQAMERTQIPESQSVPYLATLVSTIYFDAEKAFGKDKAKRGYKAAQQHVFGGDLSAIATPDVAGKLPKV